MAARVDILLEGYADMISTPASTNQQPSTNDLSTPTPNSNGRKFMKACGSCALVRSGRELVLFDTMGPWERQLLLGRLADLKVHPDDISQVVCSHSHPDHIGNLNLFTRAQRHIIGTSVYTVDIYDLNRFEPTGSYEFDPSRKPSSPQSVATENTINVIQYEPLQIDSRLSVQPTPGHTSECISLIVSDCETYGRLALAGDLFENENDIRDESIWLGAGSQNPDLQRASRQRIYNSVDFILPGHGCVFKTTRGL